MKKKSTLSLHAITAAFLSIFVTSFKLINAYPDLESWLMYNKAPRHLVLNPILTLLKTNLASSVFFLFIPLFPFFFSFFSQSPPFYSLVLRSWLQQFTPRPLLAWSGCQRWCVVNGLRVCLTQAQRLSELTAHKRAVIPCVKDDYYWHGPFNLRPLNSRHWRPLPITFFIHISINQR